MAMAFMESGILGQCIRKWVLGSFSKEDPQKKATAIDRALQLGDSGKYRLVQPAWVTQILANDPRADPSLYSENQYDCEDLGFAARVAVAHRLITQPPRDGDSPANCARLVRKTPGPPDGYFSGVSASPFC